MLFNISSSPVRPRRAGVSCLFVGLLLVIFLLQGTVRTAQAAVESPSVSTKHGAVIFQRRCVACHNKQPGDDTPFGPPNLYTAFHRTPPLSVHDAETTIRDGKGTMPGFGSILSPSEIRSVITYLRKSRR
jgi:mono/diheme cytochrome c family protein